MENQEFTPSFFRFEDLRVYEKAVDYNVWVQINTEMFPHAETNPLVKNFIFDSIEIASRISEGSSRNKPQFVSSLNDAKIAIRRCLLYTTLATKLNYFSEEQEERSRTELMELTKMIGALIASLQRDNRRGNYSKQEYNDSPNSY